MFPSSVPAAPWEASALLSNTSIAAGLPNAARLDRLTHLEGVVANLLLGVPATQGARSLPFTKYTLATPATRPGNVAQAGDFTGAQLTTFAFDASPTGPTPSNLTLTTRAADVLVADVPNCRAGDSWLILLENLSPVPFRVRGGNGVTRAAGGDPTDPLVVVPPNRALLVAVVVTSLSQVTVRGILEGRSPRNTE